jgi:RND family efflux transporter MFP subunit
MNSHNQPSTKTPKANGDGQPTAAGPPRDDAEPKGVGLKLAVVVLILALALGGGFYYVHHQKDTQEANLADQTGKSAGQSPTVDVINVKPAPSALPLVLPGETRGWYQSVIYARVNGYVGNWTADIGDRVKKGQVLATIETPDLDAQLDAAKQQLAVAQSDVAVSQANADFAQTTFQRWKDSPKGVVAPQETDEKKAAHDSSVAQLKATQAKVSAADAEVNRMKALEDYKQVTSPIDGIITERRIDIGNLVTAGSTTNTSPLYNIAQINTIRVFTDVPQDSSGQITVGMNTRCTTNSFPGRVFEGKVARTTQSIDPQTRTLKVEVDIPNPDFTLMPGMYVQVTFDVQRNALVEVPASAMLFRSSGPQVAVVNGDGQVKFQDVSIAVDNGDVVDIGSGLSAGDKVALNISSQIADGDHVNVVDTDKPAAATAAQSPTTNPAENPVADVGAH